MTRYLPNTINSVLFILYGLLGIGLGVLLLDGYISFGSFSPPSDASMTSVPRGVDIGIGMIFLTMGALGIVVGYQLWKSRISGLMMGLPLLLAGIPIAAFFASVEAAYREFNLPVLFLGLDAVMVTLIVASWKPLRHSEGFRASTQTNGMAHRSLHEPSGSGRHSGHSNLGEHPFLHFLRDYGNSNDYGNDNDHEHDNRRNPRPRGSSIPDESERVVLLGGRRVKGHRDRIARIQLLPERVGHVRWGEIPDHMPCELSRLPRLKRLLYHHMGICD